MRAVCSNCLPNFTVLHREIETASSSVVANETFQVIMMKTRMAPHFHIDMNIWIGNRQSQAS